MVADIALGDELRELRKRRELESRQRLALQARHEVACQRRLGCTALLSPDAKERRAWAEKCGDTAAIIAVLEFPARACAILQSVPGMAFEARGPMLTSDGIAQQKGELRIAERDMLAAW